MAIVAPRPTRFVFVAEWVRAQYHKDLRRIVRDWPICPADLEMWEVHARMRAASVTNLREDVRRAAEEGHTGPYPIAV